MIDFTFGKTEMLKAVIDQYGEQAQIDVAIEEMSELIKALIKDRRYGNTKTLNSVLEELADVSIMLEQLLLIYDPEGDIGVKEWVEIKLERLKERSV